MKLVKYDSSYKEIWDEFVKNSKNGIFMFQRDFMEYHSDRFDDFSLMIFNEKSKLIAVFPANISEDTIYSHQGLTFGGLLLNSESTVKLVLDIFDLLKASLKDFGVKKIIYKCIPYIYSSVPSQEDLYALFISNASLIRCDVTTSIKMASTIPYGSQRKRSIKKALKSGVMVERAYEVDEYWQILNSVLKSQHNTQAVHSQQEIKYLMEKFPDNIKLYVAKRNDVVLAGTVIFESEFVAHAQYLANSDFGKSCGALDIVIDTLISDVYNSKEYFDFGISNESDGRYLNQGLINQKEGFGARAVVHGQYEILIND
ncbi:hypothetical protein [Shewanella algae]|uniref:hypothetical protein n=1 Tax=Shewanella algae TaxID=38313 RepID=UPI0031F522FA